MGRSGSVSSLRPKGPPSLAKKSSAKKLLGSGPQASYVALWSWAGRVMPRSASSSTTRTKSEISRQQDPVAARLVQWLIDRRKTIRSATMVLVRTRMRTKADKTRHAMTMTMVAIRVGRKNHRSTQLRKQKAGRARPRRKTMARPKVLLLLTTKTTTAGGAKRRERGGRQLWSRTQVPP